MRIDGSLSNEKRHQNVNYFQENDKCRIAILGITACATGLTLTKASTVVFAEMYFTPATMIQAEDRAHRIGQEHTCVNVHYLFGKDTVDEIIFPSLEEKFVVVSNTLDAKKMNMDVHNVLNGEKGDIKIKPLSKEEIDNVNSLGSKQLLSNSNNDINKKPSDNAHRRSKSANKVKITDFFGKKTGSSIYNSEISALDISNIPSNKNTKSKKLFSITTDISLKMENNNTVGSSIIQNVDALNINTLKQSINNTNTINDEKFNKNRLENIKEIIHDQHDNLDEFDPVLEGQLEMLEQEEFLKLSSGNSKLSALETEENVEELKIQEAIGKSNLHQYSKRRTYEEFNNSLISIPESNINSNETKKKENKQEFLAKNNKDHTNKLEKMEDLIGMKKKKF